MPNRALYIGVLTGLIILVAASMGNGPLNRQADYSAWNYRIFHGVCHQIPERSLQVNGVPMAVNSRCFGIFSGMLASWLLLPFVAWMAAGVRWPGRVLLLAVVLQFLDYTAGMLSVWNSSNFSRFFLGGFLGIALVCMIAELFVRSDSLIKTNDRNGTRHG